MSGSMSWESPPPPGRGTYDWAAIAQTLKDNPGQWLRIFDHGPTSIANAIRQGSIVALIPVSPGRPGRSPSVGEGRFEVQTRNNVKGPPRTCSLYLRWVSPTTEGN